MADAKEIKKILLATDGSDATIKVDEWAAMIAKATGAHIVIVTAYNPPMTIRKRGSVMVEELRQKYEQEAKEIVAEVEDDLAKLGVTATSGLAVEGPPAESILKACEEVQPDLIVMGAGGETELKDFLLGSVAERVVRHCEVPVTIVK